MEQDYLKIKAVIDALEYEAFGPFPESQVRQIRDHPPKSAVPLHAILDLSDKVCPLLQWLSWDATFEDAKASLIAFHTASAWATCGDPESPECMEALRIAREEPSAKKLIRHVLSQSNLNRWRASAP